MSRRRPLIRSPLLAALVLFFACGLCPAQPAAELEQAFRSPPEAAKPWVYWFWLDGNITREGITADLEAMHRTGVGGVLIMEVDQGAPKGPARFGSPPWRELFKFMCQEAHRLGIEVNMNNDAGWCGSGGPWITPELAMQRLVWTETAVEGPRHFEGTLPQPKPVAGYYGDIAVFAVPVPASPAHVEGIKGKGAFAPIGVSLGAPASWPNVPAEKCIAREKIVELTSRMDAEGRLAWDVPEGRWTLLRMGHTPTGKDNHPAPLEGRGLECDKLSREAARAQFDGLMGKLIADVGPLVGKTLVSTHIDSWEVGVQNWTPQFRSEFQRRRGYDPMPLWPVMTGRVIDSMEVSERFLWDVRQTISDLLLDNYAGEFRELAHQHGLRLSIEAYHTCPCDEMAYAGRADEPMGEFWSWGKYGAAFSCTEMASAGHVYGRRIIGAEAFTATDGERWLGHPANVKDLGDWAFCEGINRFVFHRYALQPWANVKPGMSMGPWGLHYERTQTWWEQSKPWHEYLARCQYLLQQGLFVADICLLGPEGSPQTVNGQRNLNGNPLERGGYNFDTCPPEVVLTRMTVRDGRLVLPDGMSYRVLVLPNLRTMTPQLVAKIKQLAEAGATIIGSPPVKSPSLSGYPKCDVDVRDVAGSVWQSVCVPPETFERACGKGRVVWGGELGAKPNTAKVPDPKLTSAKWIWHDEGRPGNNVPPCTRHFRHVVEVEAGSPIASAQIVMTADNSFLCWVNGYPVGSGDTFARHYTMNVGARLKPGANVVAMEVVNGGEGPNPAGLIGTLVIRYRDGHTLQVSTDRTWETAATASGAWKTDGSLAGWTPAVELGPLGMEPWGDVEQDRSAPDLFPPLAPIYRYLAGTGLAPDFACQPDAAIHGFRHIHRVIGGTDVYFVANPNQEAVGALCSFRIQGRRPELWWPDSGRTERPAAYDEGDGCVRLPIRLGPSGSVFVVFREGAAIERDRVTRVTRDGQLLLDTAKRAARATAADNNAGIQCTFTMAVWLKPSADTELPHEAAKGIVGMNGVRNDALYPPPGHEVYENDEHAGCGLAAGLNGLCVFEHGAEHFVPVVVAAAPVADWTHVAVVYRNGEPSLFVNGKLLRAGLKSDFLVHPGAGVSHTRQVAAFKGERGEFEVVNRALSEAEIAELMKSMPRPMSRCTSGTLVLTRDSDNRLRAETDQPGRYVVELADGAKRTLEVGPVSGPLEVAGPWDVRFAPGGGAPEKVALDKLMSWSEHAEQGVKYFSGTAEYVKKFTVPAELLAKDRRLLLDLGRVEVMAEVKVNGRDLGLLWKPPYRVDLTGVLRPGENLLEIKVVNLWINRQIGDEQLPEDSDRNANGTLKSWPEWLQQGKPSPSGRHTFTSWRLWRKDSPLAPSGLLGPVTIETVAAETVGP